MIEDITLELQIHILRKYKTQTKAARAWGVTQSFVSMVINGKKLPTAGMLADAGIEQITQYRFKEKPDGA